MTDSKPPCIICQGRFEEHGEGKTIHAYTTNPGELVTPRQQEQMTRGAQPTPTMIRLPGAQTNEAGAIGRLVEVLLEKGVLNPPEALYVAGMGSKPQQKSGYADPAEARLF